MFFLKLWNLWWFCSGEAKDEFPGWKYKESRSFHTGTVIFSAFWSTIVNVPLKVTAPQGVAWSSASTALHLKERDGITLLQKPWPKFAKVFQSLLVDSFILFVAEKRVSTSVQKLSTPVLRWPLCRGLTPFNKSATIFCGLHSHQP